MDIKVGNQYYWRSKISTIYTIDCITGNLITIWWKSKDGFIKNKNYFKDLFSRYFTPVPMSIELNISNSAGEFCKFCRIYSQYSTNNMSDNSFICYGCRDTKNYLISKDVRFVG